MNATFASWHAPSGTATPDMTGDIQSNAALFGQETSTPEFQDKLLVKAIVTAAVEQGEDQRARLVMIKAAKNPLLEAAKPLLVVLAQMSETLTNSCDIEAFRQLLEQEIVTFQSLCNKVHIRREHAITASYSLCTALDEAASSTIWGGSKNGELGVWSSRLLASTLHGDVDGGIKFFLLTSRLIKTPEEHIDLLELFYHILCLGFQGQYSTQPNGEQRLDAIRHRLLVILTSIREPVSRNLSDHWQASPVPKLSRLGKMPAWIVLSILGLILFAEFSWYQFSVTRTRGDVIDRIHTLENTLPPPSSHIVPELRPHLSELLSDEIQRKQITVREDDKQCEIVFHGDRLFDSGKDDIHADMLPLLKKITAALVRLQGTIQITGHTDNVPIRSAQFPDNTALSLARANRVADAMTRLGLPLDRIQARGAGDKHPLAVNTSATGRARNRRIEITINNTHAVHSPTSRPSRS